MLDKLRHVKQSAYMNFKEATDLLFNGVSHQELAKTLGVSVASIRQARLDPEAKAHRTAPPEWEKAVIDLASDRIQRYRKLISAIQANRQGELFRAASGSRRRP